MQNSFFVIVIADAFIKATLVLEDSFPPDFEGDSISSPLSPDLT